MAHAMKQQQQVTSLTHTIHTERDYEPCFKVLVCNLPLTVKSPQRQLLFRNCSKRSSAKVICHKKTERSQGIGHVTMSIVHVHPVNAPLDAPKHLVLDGSHLNVNFIKKGHQRRRQYCVGNNYSDEEVLQCTAATSTTSAAQCFSPSTRQTAPSCMEAGAHPLSRCGISGWSSMVAALDRMVLPLEMGAGAVAPYFSWNLDCRCVQV